MKRSPFKTKALPDPQRQVKEEMKLAKIRARSMGLTRGPRQRGRKCYEDGIRFDSLWERECYRELKLRMAAGEIKDLQTHVPFELKVNGKLVCTIIPDFVYYDINLKRNVIADAKQPKKDIRTKRKLDREGWHDKWKLLQALYPDYNYVIYRQHSTWRGIDI